MKRTSTVYVIVLFMSLTHAMGQTPGPFYRQFNFNPYLFNPAYVGIDNSFEANLVYRQQWTNFKDAPVTAGLNVQLPANERVALGFNLVSDKQVLLRNTSFMATFGYIVPLATNQSLRFGLSGGVGLNKLDITSEEMNTNDPAILNASGNNFYVDGNFGVLYTFSGLRVGFALTDIFESNSFNSEDFNEFKLSNLRNRLFSVSYRFNVGIMENFSLEPYFLYRQTQDGLQDYWEAAALLYFKNQLWTGGSYNQNNGLAIFLGLNLKERFRFSYSYEFPPFNSGFVSASSHELHLGVKLGKKAKPIAKAATEQTAIASTAVESTAAPESDKSLHDPSMPSGGNKNPGRFVVGDDPQPRDMETPIEIKDEDRIVEAPTTPVKQEEVEKIATKPTTTKPAATKPPSKEPSESFTMTKGHYYVVVGVFSVLSHSMKFTKEMMDKGHLVNVALNPKNNFYYVYIHSTLDHEEAKRIRNEYRWKNIFKEAWVLTME